VVPAASDVGQPPAGEAGQPGAVTTAEPEAPAPTVSRETKPKRTRKKAPPKTAADITKVQGLDKKALTPEEKDAKAYFGRADTETALRNIANDLVYQPTAYRNAKMKALPDEAYFASEREATMFRGQGATLSRALCQVALDRNADAFEEVRPPTVVLTDTMISTGHLPKFIDDAYHLDPDCWIIDEP
jgi:hypothetical protein